MLLGSSPKGNCKNVESIEQTNQPETKKEGNSSDTGDKLGGFFLPVPFHTSHRSILQTSAVRQAGSKLCLVCSSDLMPGGEM